MNTSKTIPQHVVIIPNGNRTWSRKKGFAAWEGYWEAYKNLMNMYGDVYKIGINHLTCWGFSTENWKRNEQEISQIFKVVEKILTKLDSFLIKKEIGFHHFGRVDRIPEKLRKIIQELETKTQNFTSRSFNIALDYGGRDEIIRAVNTLLQEKKSSITEEEFSGYLDTKHVPDPDLIIRTAGEQRLSGLMPWQSTYAEYYSSPVPFPEFTTRELKQALIDFSQRKRTFGGDINKNRN